MAGGLGLRKLGRDVTMNAGRQVVIVAVGLLVTILIARTLGPDRNGQYAVAVLLPTTLATLLNFGIGPANVYFIGRGEVPVGSALRSTLQLWAWFSLLGVIAGLAVIELAHQQWFNGIPKPFLWIALATFPVLMLRILIASILQALQDFAQYNKMLLAVALGTLVATAVAVLPLGWGVSGAVVGTGLGAAVGLAVAFRSLQPKLQSSQVSVRGYWRRCLEYGWKAHLSNVLTFLNYRADVFLLNYLLNPAAAGIYMIAVLIAERLWTFSEAVSTALFPLLSSLHREEARRKQLTPLIARWLLLLSVIGGVALLAIAQPLIHLLFGAKYASAGPALVWLLPGIILGGSARALANDLSARGRPELNLIAAVVVVTVNIVANLMLIPRFGIAGAAIATSVAYALNAVIKLTMYARISGNGWMAPIIVRREDVAMLRTAVGRWRDARRGRRG